MDGQFWIVCEQLTLTADRGREKEEGESFLLLALKNGEGSSESSDGRDECKRRWKNIWSGRGGVGEEGVRDLREREDREDRLRERARGPSTAQYARYLLPSKPKPITQKTISHLLLPSCDLPLP